jgi:hypothetical protein
MIEVQLAPPPLPRPDSRRHLLDAALYTALPACLQIFKEAQDLLPGGVNSPVRAFKSVGGQPIVFDHVKVWPRAGRAVKRLRAGEPACGSQWTHCWLLPPPHA